MFPNLDDFHAYESTSQETDHSNGSGGTGGDGFGLGWIVIILVGVMLFYFLFSGASRDAIDSLLGVGFLAFLFARSLFR